MILILHQNNHIIVIIINTSFDQSFKFNINNIKKCINIKNAIKYIF
jgi:hypothetical protein